MSKEVIIDNEFISMWYYIDKRILHHQVHKYIYGEQLRETLEIGVRELEKNGASKWLSDDRSHSVLPQEDVKWGKEVWTPKALAAGFRHWAIVRPKSATGQLSYNQMIDDYAALGVNVNIFDNVEEAMDWLTKQ